MPVQSNPAIQNLPSIAWDGAAAFPTDISGYVRFGWAFEIMTTLTEDTVFRVQSADPSAVDPCVPGAFSDVEALADCQTPVNAGQLASITLPAGSEAGSICTATIPCRPGAFVRLVAVGGDTANVTAMAVRSGPLSGH